MRRLFLNVAGGAASRTQSVFTIIVTASFVLSPFDFAAIGEPVRLEWYNPQGERILASKRMALHTETSRSRLIIYNAIIEDAGIYRCQATDGGGHTEEASVVLEIYRKLGAQRRRE